MDIQQINNQITEFNHLTQLDGDVYIPRRHLAADNYLKGCLETLKKDSVNSKYTDEKIYNKDEIEYILKIAKELDENSPILWKAFEILGKIGSNLANNTNPNKEEQDIKNQITEFFISCILPPPDSQFWTTVNTILALYSLNNVNLINKELNSPESPKISAYINSLDILQLILETDTIVKGKYLFWKAFYQLNKILLTKEELQSLFIKRYRDFCDEIGADNINLIVNELNDILYPSLRDIKREDLIGDMYSASFGQGDLEEFVSYLEYVINNEGNFNSLISLIIKSIKKYVTAPSESINNNSTPKAEENPPYNPLEPENYLILYELRLVDYIFDHEIFQDLFSDDSLKNRGDLERYRDCYKTIFYISQLMSYEDFQNAWNN